MNTDPVSVVSGGKRSKDVHVLRAGESGFNSPSSVANSRKSSRCSTEKPIPEDAEASNTASSQRRSDQVSVVLRKRESQTPESSEERNLRRISYLKATKDDRLQIEPDLEDEPAKTASTNKKLTAASSDKHSPSIQRIRYLFGEKQNEVEQLMSVEPDGETEGVAPVLIDGEDVKEGWLTCKVAAVEGKKATDRSWKQVYVVLKSQAMFMYKDKKVANEHPLSIDEQPVSLSESHVEVAEDYTKRKNVFRVKTETGSEFLFQADSENNMHEWIEAIEETKLALVVCEARKDSGSGGTAAGSTTGGKGLKKLTSFRNRSPSAHSPAKARKASQDQGIPTKDKDKKTWKGKMAKQWKKMHQGSQPVSDPVSFPEGGSIGVPLEACPMTGNHDGSPSDPSQVDLDRVPLIVSTCCGIVEQRGLEIVGVYRVPGNNAAVSHLTELINTRGVEGFNDDPRWQDVNVVSSLLKSFFRKLPEPLFTNELYSYFIEACKIENTVQRLNTLKKLAMSLPECNFETLKFVCKHLCKVMAHSEVNKMEIRNLAIVFGPTLVRTADDNMMSMVTDMAQQCKIIESMLDNCEWFFNGEEVEDDETGSSMNFIPKMSTCDAKALITQTGNESILLSNLQKLEESGKVVMASTSSPAREVTARDIVSGIISAANRKIQRGTPPVTAARITNVKRDSVDSGRGRQSSGIEMSASTSRIQRLDTPTRCISATGSRRNSESVIQGAMTIATAVPHLIGTNNSNSPASSVSSIPAKIQERNTSSSSSSVAFKHHQSSFMVSSSSADDVNKKPSPFPFDTYVGLQEATAKRVKRFEDETKAMLAMSKASSEAGDTLSDTRVTTLDRKWRNGLEGGILVEEPYETDSYHRETTPDAQDRFLSLTYLTPSSSASSPIPKNASGSEGHKHLGRGFSMGSIPASGFTVPKVATQGNLRRLKQLNKSSTDPHFILETMPEEVAKENRLQKDNLDIQRSCDDVLNSITASFDEKLRLLLDPHYQTSPRKSDTSSSSGASLASPPVPPKPIIVTKRCPEYATANSFKERENLKMRSIASIEASVSKKPNLKEPKGDGKLASPRKTELKRGRFVDKTKEPPTRLKRNDSLTKKEKQDQVSKVRSGRGGGDDEKENKKMTVSNTKNDPAIASKSKANRKVRRRHTVGGTKDFADWEKILNHADMKSKKKDAVDEKDDEIGVKNSALNPVSWTNQLELADLNDDSSLPMNFLGHRTFQAWLKHSNQFIRASSPDLPGFWSTDTRRLSLPDSVMSDSSQLHMPSLLESQV